jgi:GTP1/Obg family GTP-binding protein
MATKRTLTEAETLEQYRVSLDNVENQSEIATIMAEFGYDTETIGQGKALLAETRQAYDANKTEDDETSEAYGKFSDLKAQLEETYSLHRKKAKVVFRNDSLTLDKLAVSGSLPKAYVKWLETVKKFYSEATSDHLIQEKLSRLKVTLDNLNAADAMVGQLENARAEYLREKGESQDATKAKDAAFVKMDDWMSEFYAVAKIALEDNPQLLESLGKLVRS